MREIKFRAWDEQNKVMHQDFQFIKSGDEGNDWIVFISDRYQLEKHETNPFTNPSPYFAQQLKIMQFTGLTDKNGKEIYEGDIVEYFDWCYASGGHSNVKTEYVEEYTPSGGKKIRNYHLPLVGVVKWNNELQTYEPVVSSYEDYNNDCFAYVCSEYKVIGNIYENKVLVK